MTARWPWQEPEVEPVSRERDSAVPEFVRNWQPVPMGTLMRRPSYPTPSRAEEQSVREQAGLDRDEDPVLVRRVPCDHRPGQCHHDGACGAPLIVLPERERGRASAAGLRARGEVWEPSK